MNNDRKRTQMVKGKKVTFTLINPADYTPPIETVTSVAVVPFDKDGNIVAALLERGPDLPGGHMQKGEKTFAETAKREALEEAFITFKKVEISYVIQSDFYGTSDDELTYMIVMAGIVKSFEEEKPDEETRGRKIMTVDAFINDYSAGDKSFMRELVVKAQETYSLMLNGSSD